MKKILITGASGFVGSSVLNYFKNNDIDVDICAPSSKELDCINEVKVQQYLKHEKFDVVLNFAVYGDAIDKSRDAAKVFEYNMRIFLNFQKCSHLYGKMIYTGSGAEYDKRYPIVDAKEEDIGGSIPVDQYGLMKYTINQIIERSDNIYNLRLFGIFGPNEYWPTKFISNICCKTLKGLPLSIYQNVYFDYIWIDDFCKMLCDFLEIKQPKFHTYNAANGTKIDLYSICKILNKVSGRDMQVYVCNNGLGNEYTANNQRILEELPGSFSFTDMEMAIRDLYSWYSANEDKISVSKLIYG